MRPPERRPAPGARADLFGDDRVVRPYCGDRLATGKVDKPGLQRLLRERGRPAHVKERTE